MIDCTYNTLLDISKAISELDKAIEFFKKEIICLNLISDFHWNDDIDDMTYMLGKLVIARNRLVNQQDMIKHTLEPTLLIHI